MTGRLPFSAARTMRQMSALISGRRVIHRIGKLTELTTYLCRAYAKSAHFPGRTGLPYSTEGTSRRRYHATGFTEDEIRDLRVMVRSAELEPGINHS